MRTDIRLHKSVKLGAELDESEAEDEKQGGELVRQMDVPRLDEPEIEL